MELEVLNQLEEDQVNTEWLKCCGSKAWAQKMTQARPFRTLHEVQEQAKESWLSCEKKDYLEAFSHHPKIGDVNSLRGKYPTKAWAGDEQKGVKNAPEETLRALVEGNVRYEDKFGYIFIVCATGKSAEEMLALLKQRLRNTPDREIEIAAGEQMKITHIRLNKLLQ